MSIFDSFRLDGKRALITGSARGIGRAIADALGDAGASVIYHGTSMSEHLQKSVSDAQKRGVDAHAIAAELSDAEQLKNLVALAGEIDILVLNASIQKYQTIEEFADKDFSDIFKVNVSSSVELIKSFLPDMVNKKWGRVLSIGSVNQTRQSPRLAIYAASKSALLNIMENCARTYGPSGVTFNNIAPGVIATDRNKEALADNSIVSVLLPTIPLCRFGTSSDCAGIALLLCSDAGSYITGADIPVSGGKQL